MQRLFWVLCLGLDVRAQALDAPWSLTLRGLPYIDIRRSPSGLLGSYPSGKKDLRGNCRKSAYSLMGLREARRRICLPCVHNHRSKWAHVVPNRQPAAAMSTHICNSNMGKTPLSAFLFLATFLTNRKCHCWPGSFRLTAGSGLLSGQSRPCCSLRPTTNYLD